MAERAGQDILILVDVAGDGSDFRVVASQTNATLEETNELIVFKTKESRNPTKRVGAYNATMTLEHLYVPEDQSLEYLKTATRLGETVKIRLRDQGQDVEQADAVITSRSQAFPDAAPATVSLTLEISGQWGAVG